ncbi:glucose-6-phosphate isomerase [Symbiobacterium terraclitae]|uniref:glucose-6-phosphate isomerase n=1 Tax=Symbiobacterium terraclitae TaxID=557451 RepID=UPI0035B54886
MNSSLRFDVSRAAAFVAPHEIEYQAAAVRAAHDLLHGRRGPGAEFTGWLDLPERYDREEFRRIQEAAARIRSDSDALVVIGIGGSYLGARATVEALGHAFHNLLPKDRRPGPQIFFAGKDLSPVYLTHLFEVLEGKEVSVNVVSKSGTTTEPAIAFRIFREYLERRYGKDGARRRIYATTDRRRGILKQVADAEGYESFVIPDEVGGRYSVLTAVGLLPIAAAGIDIAQLMAGAASAMAEYAEPDLAQNPCYQYAAARHALYRKGRTTELLVTYEPALRSTAEWWKQLFGESEGKDGKGIFPASVEFTTDLHSMGQYIQDGLRNLFETVVQVERPRADIAISGGDAGDGLGFLEGQTLDHVNRMALAGTLLAHTDGGVPNLLLTLPELTPYHYGQMIYFFEKACAISGYLLGVNPFDQPGVEAYKQNMYALLGKPGFEARRAELERRLNG